MKSSNVKVLILATQNNPMQESSSIIDSQISLADLGTIVATGVQAHVLHADCTWIQGFYKNATLALQFIKERDMSRMTRQLKNCSHGAKMSIHFDKTDGQKLNDFVDDTMGDIMLDLRHIATQRPSLTHMAEQHQQRLQEFLTMHRMPILASLCNVNVAGDGMNFQINL